MFTKLDSLVYASKILASIGALMGALVIATL